MMGVGIILDIHGLLEEDTIFSYMTSYAVILAIYPLSCKFSQVMKIPPMFPPHELDIN
jgi:hypothetical protein